MRATVVALAFVVGLALGGCDDTVDEHPGGREINYPTHCGVGQMRLGGVTYYPTGIYKDGEPFATDSGANGGPTPWDYPHDPAVSDGNSTFGVIVMNEFTRRRVTSPCDAAVESPVIWTTLLNQSVLPAAMAVLVKALLTVLVAPAEARISPKL